MTYENKGIALTIKRRRIPVTKICLWLFIAQLVLTGRLLAQNDQSFERYDNTKLIIERHLKPYKSLNKTLQFFLTGEIY